MRYNYGWKAYTAALLSGVLLPVLVGALPPLPFTTASASADTSGTPPGAPQPPPSPRVPPPLPKWCSAEPSHPDLKPTSMYRGGPAYKIYSNLLFHNMKWYSLMDDKANNTEFEDGISVNNGAIKIPVASTAHFLSSLQLCHVKGTTLMVDFPFPAFPDNLGHFAEIILPAFSVLHSTDWRDHLAGGSKAVNWVLISNLRSPLMDWYSEALILTLSAAATSLVDFPPPIDASELEAYDRLGWIMFENVVVPQDRYTHPKRLTGFTQNEIGDWWKGQGTERYVAAQWKVGFSTHQDSAEFRRRAYVRTKWPAPAPWTPGEPPALPKVITLLQYPEDYPEIVNSGELLALLREVAGEFGWKVRVTSLTMEAPFASHVAVMAGTGVLVARHGPILTNSVLLPAGAMVLELLPYKWEWQAISRLYHNMTQSTGLIHHFAWRPMDPQWCGYKEPQDVRYHSWTAAECSGRECLMVHARAGLKVDLAAVRATLMAKLPRVIAGEPVEALREPWPDA